MFCVSGNTAIATSHPICIYMHISPIVYWILVYIVPTHSDVLHFKDVIMLYSISTLTQNTEIQLMKQVEKENYISNIVGNTESAPVQSKKYVFPTYQPSGLYCCMAAA